MNALAVLAVAAIAPGATQGSLVTLAGAVRDSAGAPCRGAEIRMETRLAPVYTDSSGEFWIDSVPSGRGVLHVRKAGFQPQSVDFTIPDGAQGDVDLDDIVLRPAVPRLINLAGTVRDAISHRPIEGASLRMGGDTRFTDSLGHFLRSVVVRGSVSVELTRLGFRPLRFDLWPGPGQDTVKLAIGLRPLAFDLSEVVIEGGTKSTQMESDFDRHRKAGFGTFLTAERIRTISSISAVDLLRWAGVQVNGDVFAERGRFLRLIGVPYGCGTAGRGPVIFIDGRRWPTETAMAYLEATDPKEIAGVEAYPHPGTMPVEYNGPDAECGVVVFWYRPQ